MRLFEKIFINYCVEGIDFQSQNTGRCKTTAKAHKYTNLDYILKNLVILIKRFNQARRKVCKKVDHAFEIELREHVSPGKVLEDKAQLFAVVVHYGRSSSSGHYYAFINVGQHWFRIDDMKIVSVQETSLVNCQDQAYILFYKTLPRPYIN